MNKIIALATVFTVITAAAAAQTAVSRVYIKGGKDAWPNYLHEVYLVPAFEQGVVEYKNGQRFRSVLNYNRVIGSIQFIDEKGDTLALSDEASIRTVVIGNYTFFPSPVTLQKIAGNEKFTMARNERIRLADKQKVGAFGLPTSSGTIDSYDGTNNRNNNTFDVNEQLLIRKTTNFYISGPGYSFVPASRKNVLSIFSSAQDAIKKFITDRQIDFNDEADILALSDYLETL